MKLMSVTIDVEPDCSPSWHYSDPLRFEGVRVGIGERLQPLFDSLGVRPTYLINNVVLEDPESVTTLRGLGRGVELGTHLHPEFIEPGKVFTSYAGVKAESNLCSFAPDVEFRKIEGITKLFEERVGFTPRVFRAGRFSAGTNTIRSLERLGYLVDTSVTPNVIWDDSTRERPVDFRTAPGFPYLVGDSILQEDRNGSVLEVPVSIGTVRRWFHSRVRWLRPKLSTYGDLRALTRVCTNAQRHRGMVVLNMMFHNVEVVSGLSPYSLTPTDCVRYLSTLERFLGLVRKEGFLFVTLSELYELIRPRR